MIQTFVVIKSIQASIVRFLRNWVVGSVIVLCACSITPDDKDPEADWTPKKFYENAKTALNAGNYDKAIRLYEKLEARYPFGTYAAQSQLDIAYAYFKFFEPDSAIAAADRFINLHPQNPYIDYAYYLKGLVNYERGIGFIERILPIDATQRDPGPARDALQIFSDLTARFPESRYSDDAKQRIIALRNNLAMYEINVARYYIKRGAYVAAANRASYVIETYQRTQAIPLALQIMEHAYSKVGINELARDAKRVYSLNYGEDAITAEQAALENRSWGRKVWDFIGLDR